MRRVSCDSTGISAETTATDGSTNVVLFYKNMRATVRDVDVDNAGFVSFAQFSHR